AEAHIDVIVELAHGLGDEQAAARVRANRPPAGLGRRLRVRPRGQEQKHDCEDSKRGTHVRLPDRDPDEPLGCRRRWRAASPQPYAGRRSQVPPRAGPGARRVAGWWALGDPVGPPRRTSGAALLYLFGARMQGSVARAAGHAGSRGRRGPTLLPAAPLL